MKGRAAQGFPVGGRAFGYKSMPVYDGSRKDAFGRPAVIGCRRVIDEGEADVVRRIFHLYAEGISPMRIAHLLNG